jgi:hypothetical protein
VRDGREYKRWKRIEQAEKEKKKQGEIYRKRRAEEVGERKARARRHVRADSPATVHAEDRADTGYNRRHTTSIE